MQCKKIFASFFLLTTFFCSLSCRSRTATLCQTDGGNCITIQDNQNTRLIYFNAKKKLNFIKLDISKVDLESDGIFICWDNSNNKVILVNPKTTVLEESYDTNHYSFKNKLPTNLEGLPNALIFHAAGCCEYNIFSNSIFPKDNGVVIKP